MDVVILILFGALVVLLGGTGLWLLTHPEPRYVPPESAPEEDDEL